MIVAYKEWDPMVPKVETVVENGFVTGVTIISGAGGFREQWVHLRDGRFIYPQRDPQYATRFESREIAADTFKSLEANYKFLAGDNLVFKDVDS